MGRNSRCEGFPGGKEFPGGKDFLVGRNSRCEGFPGGKEFPVGRNPDNKDFPVIRISRRKKRFLCGKYFPIPGVKDFQAGKVFWWERCSPLLPNRF